MGPLLHLALFASSDQLTLLSKSPSTPQDNPHMASRKLCTFENFWALHRFATTPGEHPVDFAPARVSSSKCSGDSFDGYPALSPARLRVLWPVAVALLGKNAPGNGSRSLATAHVLDTNTRHAHLKHRRRRTPALELDIRCKHGHHGAHPTAPNIRSIGPLHFGQWNAFAFACRRQSWHHGIDLHQGKPQGSDES